MTGGIDLKAYKRDRRARYRAIRADLDPVCRGEMDDAIRENILKLPVYQACDKLLCFVSTEGEVETRTLIRIALEAGKAVAVPYCVPGSFGVMEFYPIDGLDELVESAYGIPEPEPSNRRPLEDFSGTLCIVPGLAYDRAGYRLGYGGGYYDRFLSGPFAKSGVSVGVCYETCIESELVRGSYDLPCDWLVSDAGAWRISADNKNE